MRHRVDAWWRDQPGVTRFRLYTGVTLQVTTLVIAVYLAALSGKIWAAAGIVIAGVAAAVALDARPTLTTWGNPGLHRWSIPTAAAVLFVCWVSFAVIAGVSESEPVTRAASTATIFVTLLIGLSILPFIPFRWWALTAIGIATGVALGSSWHAMLGIALATCALGAFLVATTLLSLWGLRVVDDLDRARGTEAKLRVAEERLRFSRDLHDVVGRGFSAVAVKSELAATLLRSGADERAAAELDEIKQLAVESMEQMRTLVRGYRGVDLPGEVAGARSLLSAAGCELTVQGEPSRVPTEYHEVAAWVVREGTTNIVKHSAATSASLTLGPDGMSLRNNGAGSSARVSPAGEHSGLRGLTERLSTVGASLDSHSSGDAFELEIHWKET